MLKGMSASEAESLRKQIEDIEAEIQKKESKIAKLKDGLTRSMRSDKSREQEVEALHIDLTDKDHKIETLTAQIAENKTSAAKQGEDIAKLESDLTSLTNQLQTGSGCEVAQKKNDRMKQMLDKSNALYTELEAKLKKITSENESIRQKIRNPPSPKAQIILGDDKAIVLNEDSSFREITTIPQTKANVQVYDCRSKKESQKQEPAERGDQLLKTYFRSVILEFLVGDSDTQIRLIPVLLKLLDCSPEQIESARRSFAEGSQIISKAASALGI